MAVIITDRLAVMDIDATARENLFVDREYMGNLSIAEKSNILTFVLGESSKMNQGGRSFYLNKIFLEKVN